MSIDRSKIYYKTWTNERGHAMRAELHIAGYDQTTLGNMVKLKESILELRPGKFSFKDNPLGVPDAPSVTLILNFPKLPSNLREALLNPEADSAGGSQLGEILETADGTSISSFTTRVTNQLYIFSNRGVTGGRPTSSSITNAGLNYAVASGLATTTNHSGIGCTVDVNTVVTMNPITAVMLMGAGSGGYTSGRKNLAPISSAHGGGGEVDITDDGLGAVASINSITDGGIDWAVGDTATILDGANDAWLQVTAITDGGKILSATMHGGTNYNVGDEIYLSFNGNAAAVLTVGTVSSQPRYVEFVGAQSSEFSSDLGVDSDGNVTGKMEVTFFDVFKTMCDALPARALAQCVRRNEQHIAASTTWLDGSATTPTPIKGNADVFYDIAFKATTGKQNMVASLNKDAFADAANKVTGVMVSIASVFRDFFARTIAASTNHWVRGAMSGTLTYSDAVVANSPISHLTFFRQNYSSNHKKGTSIAEDSVCVIGFGVRATSSGAIAAPTDWMITQAERYTGILEPDKNGETLIAGSLWDLLRDVAANFGCKLQWWYEAVESSTRNLYSYRIHVSFSPVLAVAIDGTHDVDTLRYRDTEAYYKYKPSANVISEAVSEVKNATSADTASLKASNVTSKGKARLALPMLLHNHPTAYDLSTQGQLMSADNQRAVAGGTTTLVFYRVPLSLRKLWYFESGSTSPFADIGAFNPAQRVFKVHESFDINTGYLGITTNNYSIAAMDDGGTASINNADTLPAATFNFPIPGGTSWEFVDAGTLIFLQQHALGFGLASVMLALFGNRAQSIISRTFENTPKLHGFCVGDRVEFTAPNGTPIPVHASRSQGYVLSVESDYARGIIKVDILTSGI